MGNRMISFGTMYNGNVVFNVSISFSISNFLADLIKLIKKESDKSDDLYVMVDASKTWFCFVKKLFLTFKTLIPYSLVPFLYTIPAKWCFKK